LSDSRQGELPLDIAIVGLGTVGVHQLTREAEETLRRSRHVFLLDGGFGVAEYLERLGPKITTFSSTGRSPSGLHQEIAAAVLAAAQTAPPVSFATRGHPRIGGGHAALIERGAASLGLRVAMLPGISPLDTLLADLGIDPTREGLQVFDADDLLVQRRPVLTDVPCLLSLAPGTAPDDLRRHLLQFYPPEHTIVIAAPRTFLFLSPVLAQGPLTDLAALLSRVDGAQTVYLPPAYHRIVADRDALRDSRRDDATATETDSLPRRPGRPSIGPQPPR
jgi:uncharacterized protein YabN with tetrapyrrole methylase and pyrophosphatase domain